MKEALNILGYLPLSELKELKRVLDKMIQNKIEANKLAEMLSNAK